MRFKTALAWVLWIGFCSMLCAGLFAGCYDPTFAWPRLTVPGATPAQRTAYEQNEALRFDPYPDPNLSHVDPGERPLGYEVPREPYPLRPLPAPIIVTSAPTSAPPTTVTAPYPSAGLYPTPAPGSFPAASPAPYPGAIPGSGVSPNVAPIPGPTPYAPPQ